MGMRGVKVSLSCFLSQTLACAGNDANGQWGLTIQHPLGGGYKSCPWVGILSPSY